MSLSLDLTVLLISIPERADVRAEAVQSIVEQTAKVRWIMDIAEPEPHRRPAAVAEARNRLLDQVTTEWVAIFDDDDVYLPNHFERIAPLLDDHVDIVHTNCDVYPCRDVSAMTSHELAERLLQSNMLTSNATIRTSFARALNGWGGPFNEQTGRFTDTGVWSDDWDFWIRAAQNRGRFKRLNEQTWRYRLHDGQASKQWSALHHFG